MNKKSVCIILVNEDGLYLAVSRKHDHSDFGLPGGKVEENETSYDAIIRETKEETGLDIENIKIVYVADYQNYEAICYTANHKGKIEYDKSVETGVVKWVTKDILFQGSFGDYNKEAFEIYEKEFKNFYSK